NLSFVQRESPIEDAAAHSAVCLTGGESAIHVRIESPKLLTCLYLDRKSDAPVCDSIKNAVGEKRRRFLIATSASHGVRPREPQACDVGTIDLAKRAETRFGVAAAVGQPLFA